MKALKRKRLTIFLMVIAPFLLGFSPLSALKNEEGNKYYKKGQVGKAKTAYLSALKGQPESPEIAFNLGNAYYREESFKDSLDSYKVAAQNERSSLLRSKAFYNLGNNLFRLKELDKAAEFYKQALRLNPKDADAKHNLEMLLKEEQDQKKDQQQNQGGGGGQQNEAGQNNQEEEKDKQDQKNQEQDQEEKLSEGESQKEEGQDQKKEGQSLPDRQAGEQQKKAEEEQGQGEGEGEEKERPKTPGEIRAEQILGALEDQEKQVLRVQRGGNKNASSNVKRIIEKDW